MSNEMTVAMKQHGAFSWNELMTSDIEGAKVFYQALFDWSLDEMTAGDMDYTIAKSGETEVAGMMAMPLEVKGMPPMWGAYVTVDEVDVSARKVIELGGKILMEPTDIPGIGRFCTLQDPQGAVLSMMTYEKNSSASGQED